MKIIAFLKRDVQIDLSYKLRFLMQFIGIFFSTALTFFVSELIGSSISNKLAGYGGDYFSFVIVGIALTDYLSVSLEQFSDEIRTAQLEGTLETLLVTPTSVYTILFSSSLYNFFLTSLRVMVYILLGLLLFGLKLHLTSILALVVLIILTIGSFAGIGLISAAFILVLKRGSPISLLVMTVSGLLGGVFYPVDILPAWLVPVAQLLPITHALEAMRQILLNGASFAFISEKVLILVLFSAILIPMGLAAFGYGLKIAKREGSLLYY
jgi:ABC-2 type transport system permease protein